MESRVTKNSAITESRGMKNSANTESWVAQNLANTESRVMKNSANMENQVMQDWGGGGAGNQKKEKVLLQAKGQLHVVPKGYYQDTKTHVAKDA
jgi:hypothetical protein